MSDKKTKNMKEYFKKYKETHVEMFKETTKCEICGGKYSYTNRATHYKSLKHKYATLLLQTQDDIKKD